MRNFKIISIKSELQGKKIKIEKLPYYATPLSLDMGENFFLEGLYYRLWLDKVIEPATEEGKIVINHIVEELMKDDEMVNERIDCIFLKLVHTENWDRWAIDSINESLKIVIDRSIENIINSKNNIEIMGAVQRLYKIAYIEKHPQYYEEQKQYHDLREQPLIGLNEFEALKVHEVLKLNMNRLQQLHEILIKSIDKVLSKAEDNERSKFVELQRLREVFVFKQSLKEYIFHSTRVDRIESIKEHGLNVNYTRQSDERPDYIFFWDWSCFDEYSNKAQDKAYVRLRIQKEGCIDLVSNRSSKYGIEDFHDMRCDYFAKGAPVEYIEVLDPFEPWKGYPLKDLTLEQIKEIYERRTFP